MQLLIIGMAIFVGIHLIPSAPNFKASLLGRFGEDGYKRIYSLLALAGLGMIIYGKAVASYNPVWYPPIWSRHLVWAMMLPALILIVAANVPGNVKRLTPHPMMWAVSIWAIAHLAANGDKASIILFAPLLAFAAIHIVSANSRGAQVQSEKLPLTADLKVVIIGIAVYVVLLFAHPFLFKVSAL
ncbi:MAG: NnrU family protein [Oceanicoccus sp.]